MKENDAKCGQRFYAYFLDTLIIGTIGTIILRFLPVYTKYYSLYQEAYLDIYEVMLNFGLVDPQAFINLMQYFLVAQCISYAVMLPLFFLYLVILPYFCSFQTIGRLAAGVKVVHLKDEQKASFGRLCLRELVGSFLFYEILSSSVITIIVTWYLSASKGRSIVDYIGGTRLINLRMPPKEEPIYEEPQDLFPKKDYIDAEFKDANQFEENPYHANQLNDSQQDSDQSDDQNSDTEEEYKVI